MRESGFIVDEEDPRVEENARLNLNDDDFEEWKKCKSIPKNLVGYILYTGDNLCSCISCGNSLIWEDLNRNKGN